MKITFFILLLFCALKTSAQGLGGEIKRSDNTPTDKAAMKQKSFTSMERVSNWTTHLLKTYIVLS